MYDFRLDDAGISLPLQDDEDEEVLRTREVQWLSWMHGLPKFTIEPDTKFADIIVPTPDTVRSAHILEMLLKNNKTV